MVSSLLLFFYGTFVDSILLCEDMWILKEYLGREDDINHESRTFETNEIQKVNISVYEQETDKVVDADMQT